MDELLQYLDHHNLEFQRFDHPAVFTCEEADALEIDMPGADLKNLFLRDGKGSRHFVVALPAHRRVNLKALNSVLGVTGLGFASKERLQRLLRLEPGSVTLLAAFNDPDGQVEFVIDKSLWQASALLCHPLINTSTLAIEPTELAKFFSLTGHEPRIIDVPYLEDAVPGS